MDKLTFSVWYNGNKNLCKLYDLFKDCKFFNPKEIFVNETNDNSFKKHIMSENEISKIFYETFNNGDDSCVTIGGYGFVITICPTICLGNFHIISFDISPKALKGDYDSFEKLFKETVEITDAFYGLIDSISNSGDIFDEEKEDVYKPNEYIQAMFLGNYFGGNYTNHPNVKKIVESDYCISEKIGDGWFVKLSDDISGFASEEVKRNRKKLRKYVKTITGYHFIRYKD